MRVSTVARKAKVIPLKRPRKQTGKQLSPHLRMGNSATSAQAKKGVVPIPKAKPR